MDFQIIWACHSRKPNSLPLNINSLPNFISQLAIFRGKLIVSGRVVLRHTKKYYLEPWSAGKSKVIGSVVVITSSTIPFVSISRWNYITTIYIPSHWSQAFTPNSWGHPEIVGIPTEPRLGIAPWPSSPRDGLEVCKNSSPRLIPSMLLGHFSKIFPKSEAFVVVDDVVLVLVVVVVVVVVGNQILYGLCSVGIRDTMAFVVWFTFRVEVNLAGR